MICGQNTEFFIIKISDTHCRQCALKFLMFFYIHFMLHVPTRECYSAKRLNVFVVLLMLAACSAHLILLHY
jgi:hypothetical protein